MGVYGIGVLEKKIHDRCYNTRGYNYCIRIRIDMCSHELVFYKKTYYWVLKVNFDKLYNTFASDGRAGPLARREAIVLAIDDDLPAARVAVSVLATQHDGSAQIAREGRRRCGVCCVLRRVPIAIVRVRFESTNFSFVPSTHSNINIVRV